MAITIETYEDEVEFAQYAQPRMELLSIIDTGVYPNTKKLLTAFSAFNARLSPGGDLAKFKDHDDLITINVRPYTDMIVQHLGAVMQIIEGIELAAPGTFPAAAKIVEVEPLP